MYVMKIIDAEEICNHWVDGGRLLCAPQYSGSVIQTREGSVHARFWECREKSDLVENKGDELKVGVCELSL